jgi:hypothetical protein
MMRLGIAIVLASISSTGVNAAVMAAPMRSNPLLLTRVQMQCTPNSCIDHGISTRNAFSRSHIILVGEPLADGSHRWQTLSN